MINSDFPFCTINSKQVEFVNGRLIDLPKEFKKRGSEPGIQNFFTNLITKDFNNMIYGVDPFGFNFIIINNFCYVGLIFEGDNTSLFNNTKKKYPSYVFDKKLILGLIEKERNLESFYEYVPIEIVTQNIHELRNLNSKISSNIDLLLNINEEDDWGTKFEKSEENLKKIYVGSRLIKFILDNIKFYIPNYIEELKIDYTRSFIVHKSLFKIAQIFKNDFKKKKSEIVLDGKSFKKISGDKEVFEIVIMLLIENALKYSNDPSSIPPKVTLKEENNILLINVSSFGNIIPMHERSKLFSRGFRSSVHYSKVDGTGMGLHNASKILKHFNSDVTYSTQNEDSQIGWNHFTIKCNKIF